MEYYRLHDIIHRTRALDSPVMYSEGLQGSLLNIYTNNNIVYYNRDTMCIFYLVCRALDTVEDDPTISNPTKLPMLREFHKNLYDPLWKFLESKDKYHIVLDNFPEVSHGQSYVNTIGYYVNTNLALKIFLTMP